MQLGGACNCRCTFCEADPRPEVTPEAVRARAEATRPAVLVLTGPGEPLMRRDLAELVHAARRGTASAVALVTNGRALAYPRAAGAVASLEPSHVIVSLLSAYASVHDALTRTDGSHAQTLDGLAHLAALVRDRRTSLVVRTVPHDGLEDGVDDLVSLARARGAAHVWVDGEWPHERGQGVLVGPEVERILLQVPHEERSREGSAEARMHPEERAVSLVVRTGCRNACSFCTTRIIQEKSRAPWVLDDLTQFHASLEEGASRGFDSLRFVAVEPLEHPDLPDLVARARDLGYTRIEAWTSARSLADPGHAEELASRGLTAVCALLLGSSAEVHDAAARAPGSFDETMAGLRRARELLEVSTHVVLVRQNLDDLERIVDMARSMGLGEPDWVVVPAPSSEDREIYRSFAPGWTHLARTAAGLAPDVMRKVIERGLLWQVPPCVLERTEGIDPDWIRSLVPPPPEQVSEGSKDQPGAALKMRSPCPLEKRCAAADRCPGLYTIHVDVFGTHELLPFEVDT